MWRHNLLQRPPEFHSSKPAFGLFNLLLEQGGAIVRRHDQVLDFLVIDTAVALSDPVSRLLFFHLELNV